MIGPAMQLRGAMWGAVAVISMLSANTTVSAESCGFLGLDPLSIDDGALFKQTTDGWRQIEGLEAPEAATAQSLAYAIRAVVPRQGAIVIKSGMIQDSRSTTGAQSIRLIRLTEALAPCGGVPFPAEGTAVSWRSYADFHDFGRAVEPNDSNAIYGFHFRYLRSGSQCVSTADTTSDGVLSFDGRSNRSQFSFDPSVVAKGSYSQILSTVFLNKASAGSANLANLRVEISGYEAQEGTPTCIRFTLPGAGAQTFIRIVDLEARDSRPPFPRLPEKVWERRN